MAAADGIFDDGFEERLIVKKSCPSVVVPGEYFNYVIDYYALSPTGFPNTALEDFLPLGIGIRVADIAHKWNLVHSTNNPGAPAPSITVDAGRVVVQPGPLGHMEGGRMSLLVVAGAGLVSGEHITNELVGSATDNTNTTRSYRTECRSLVSNADLYLRKRADPLEVVGEAYVTFELVISNEGAAPARDLVILDLLHPGMRYVRGTTTVMTPGWSLSPSSEPETENDGQELRWSASTGNALTRDGWPPGEIPGESGDIVISFQAEVDYRIPPPPFLQNCAYLETVSTQDSNYDDSACVEVKFSPPD